VARMPRVDLTTGSACCPRSFSALGDQRAEIPPVQRPAAFAAGPRCSMRLTQVLMLFPFFLSASRFGCPESRSLPQCPENRLGNRSKVAEFNRPVNSVEKLNQMPIFEIFPSGRNRCSKSFRNTSSGAGVWPFSSHLLREDGSLATGQKGDRSCVTSKTRDRRP